MTINNLKSGDICLKRDGTIVYINKLSKIRMKYNDDLTHKTDNRYDVVKVQRYVPKSFITRSNNNLDCFILETIYERKEEILDDKEKEYLRGVVKPFRNKIRYIKKYESGFRGWLNRITICFKDGDFSGDIDLPPFLPNAMYKGMEIDKEYSLDELGL